MDPVSHISINLHYQIKLPTLDGQEPIRYYRLEITKIPDLSVFDAGIVNYFTEVVSIEFNIPIANVTPITKQQFDVAPVHLVSSDSFEMKYQDKPAPTI